MLVRDDDFTQKSWIYFLASKSDAQVGLDGFLSDVAQDGKVEVVRTDNGGEFRVDLLRFIGTTRCCRIFRPPTVFSQTALQERVS